MVGRRAQGGSEGGVMDQAARPSLRQALLSPRSVAIVGQSDDAGKTTGRPLKYLRQAGFAGKIFSVNARRKTVLGEKAWPSVAALIAASVGATI